jgi:hypothetical protein
MMNMLSKGLMGAFVAASVVATAPAYAGITAPVKADAQYSVDQSASYYKRKHRSRYYAGDQRVNSNTRIWRGDDGRYYCRRDNGTTGLLIGAAVGGLAGHEIAGRGDKTLGVVLGAAGGALLGREIDRSNYRCR